MAGIRWSDELAPAAGPATAADDRGSIIVEQSAMRQWGGIAFALAGGIIFIGLAGASADFGVVGIAGFGFFGLLALASAFGALARGTDSALIEVQPDWLWLPGMGRLPWDEIEEVRLENLRGIVNSDSGATRSYRRIGVVPLDHDLKPDVSTRVAWLLADGFFRFMRRMGPGFRIGGEDLAPFAFNEMETTPAEFDAALAIVRRYVDVVDADQRRARERAPRWAARQPAAAVAPDELRAIDARLDRAATSQHKDQLVPAAPVPAALVPAAPVPAALVPPASARPPEATFMAAPMTPADLRRAILSLAGPIGFLLAAKAAGALEDVSPLGLVAVGAVVLVPFLLAGLPHVVRLVRQAQRHEGPRAVLRVGPAGIWLPELGTVPWGRVGVLRTEMAGSVRTPEGGVMPRWRLVVGTSPGDGEGTEAGVASDKLDVPFDDVLDLVRYYHPVDDR